MKILKKNININTTFGIRNIFGISFHKFNFARKTSNKSTGAKKDNNSDSDLDENFDSKTINVVREEVPIKISPYFSKAVSEKEKSASSINISQLVEAAAKNKKTEEMSVEQKNEIIKTKQKLTAAKKQQAKTIGVVVENIKRELPKEL